MNTITTTTTTSVATVATVAPVEQEQQEQPFSFEQAIEDVGKTIISMYDDADVAEQVAVAAQNATKAVMEPVYAAFLVEIDARDKKINDLVRRLDEAHQASDAQKPQLKDLKVPTLQWIIENHKGKGEKLGLNAYNLFCMAYRKLFDHFPLGGEWKGMDQEPWKVLASQYNAYRTAMKNSSPTIISPFAAPAPVPVAPVSVAPVSVAPVSKATSAYQLWLEQWRSVNKGKGLAPTGTWKNLPDDEKAEIEKKFAALKASRAQQA